MKKSISLAGILFPMLLVMGCAGSGVKGVGQLIPAIESDQTAILVMRDTGFSGTAALVEVAVDGIPIGDLGNKESLLHPVSPGDHTVAVRFKGIGGLGLNKEMKSFSVENGEKVFYQINLKMGLLTNELVLNGVTKETFIFADQ
jgi:hypothetical protein|tara:strand:- start:1046 stop:1477 length:432 start_codon:yes stop_codon:yes gene_type:complete